MSVFDKWNDFYRQESSWSDYLRSLSDYDRFFECIIEENPRKVLEVGCGPATKSVALSCLGFDCTAVDNNKDVLDLARRTNEKFRGQVRFLEQDAFALDFPDASFDLAHHAGLLEHFSDEEIVRLLREQLRVARKVVFTVPNEHYPTLDFGNERLMSRSRWESILKDFNLEVSDYFHTQFSGAVLSILWEGLSLKILKKDVRKQIFYMAKLSGKTA